MDKLELEALLYKDTFIDVLLSKSRIELCELFGEPFSKMKDYSQNNPHHCYDLLEHTLRTVSAIECADLSKAEETELKIAALYHDIGKPIVAFEKEGRTVFYNHAKESEKIARKLLQNIGYKGIELERICFFIERHDEFISFKHKTDVKNDTNPFIKPITIKTVYQRICKVQNEYLDNKQFTPSFYDFKLLLRLCRADVKAQKPQVIQDGVLIDTIELKSGRLDSIARKIDIILNSDSIYCDMHVHSAFSDGTDMPKKLIEKAEKVGLAALALTDHNTIDGLQNLIDESKSSNIDVISGIEFSTEYCKKELHVVGLFIESEQYEKVKAFLNNARIAKAKSNELLITNLKNAGYDVDYEELKKYANKPNINRAVIALYLVDKGILQSVKEGFETILSPKAGYYIPPQRRSTLETIEFIKSVGAVAVLAHPLIDLSSDELALFLPEAKKAGLDAIETSYSLYDSETQATAEKLALNNGLLFSGGSDYHGEAKPHISLGTGQGTLRVPLKYYLSLIDCLG